MKIEMLKFFPKEGGKSFIGLKYIDNTVQIHYPKSFHWKNNDSICIDTSMDISNIDVYSLFSNDILMLLNSISLAKTLSTNEELAASILSTKEDFSLISYLWIINDYLTNGLYKNREPCNKVNASGKINWKKTMQQHPFVTQNGNLIYSRIISTIKNDSENIITEIYRYCINKSIYLVGWLFGMNYATFGIESVDIELSESVKLEYNYHLNLALNKTFDDVMRVRLKNMINIVNGLNKSNDGYLVYGVNEYHYVFEKMINSIFGTKITKDFHPKGIWHSKTNEIHESSSLEPDTITMFDDICVIIDAKCYKYFYTGFLNGSHEGLPQTSSIQKQITYGDHIYKLVTENKLMNINKDKIYNCFLLPFDKQYEGRNYNNIEYVMYADTNWKEKSYSYDEIYAFFIDMRYVIESWNSQDHRGDIIDLVNQILKLKNDMEMKETGIWRKI